MSDPNSIRQQAYEWRARLDDEAVSSADRVLFDRWIAQDPAHRDAFALAQARWQSLGRIDPGQLQAQNPTLFRSSHREHWNQLTCGHGASIGVVLCVVLMLSLGLGMRDFSFVSAPEPLVYSTGIGDMKMFSLPDGSSLSLGAASEARISMSPEARHIQLLHGELFVDVAHQAERPLIVRVDALAFQAVGTAFEVRRRRGGASVAVSDGQVAVLNGSDRTADIVLSPGQGMTAVAGRPADIETLPLEQIGAWREARLVYRGATLRDVVDDANRYSVTKIAFASASLESLRVTATFRGDDIPTMLNTLEDVFPLRVDRSASNEIVLFAD